MNMTACCETQPNRLEEEELFHMELMMRRTALVAGLLTLASATAMAQTPTSGSSEQRRFQPPPPCEMGWRMAAITVRAYKT